MTTIRIRERRNLISIPKDQKAPTIGGGLEPQQTCGAVFKSTSTSLNGVFYDAHGDPPYTKTRFHTCDKPTMQPSTARVG
jgi:hypothetical protein